MLSKIRNESCIFYDNQKRRGREIKHGNQISFQKAKANQQTIFQKMEYNVDCTGSRFLTKVLMKKKLLKLKNTKKPRTATPANIKSEVTVCTPN